MKVILFVKNFTKEYITYLISKIPTFVELYINYLDYYVDYRFTSDIFGYIYGSKEDETFERVKLNYVHKDEPTTLDIDELHYFFLNLKKY
jgi:hypothetical protein